MKYTTLVFLEKQDVGKSCVSGVTQLAPHTVLSFPLFLVPP